ETGGRSSANVGASRTRQWRLLQEYRYAVGAAVSIDHAQRNVAGALGRPGLSTGEWLAADRGAIDKEGERRRAGAHLDGERRRLAGLQPDIDGDTVSRERDLRQVLVGGVAEARITEVAEGGGKRGRVGDDRPGGRGLERNAPGADAIECLEQNRRR